MEDESGLPSDPEQLANVIENCENKTAALQAKIVQEDAKREKYRVRDNLSVFITHGTCYTRSSAREHSSKAQLSSSDCGSTQGSC